MLDYKLLATLNDGLTDRIGQDYPRMLACYPVSGFLEKIEVLPQIGSYKPLGQAIDLIGRRISAEYGPDALETYHKLILITLILGAEEKIKRKKIPDDIVVVIERNFNRIINKIEAGRARPGFYLFRNDRFCKDFAACILSMIPLGMQKIHLDGLSRRDIVSKGIINFIKLSRVVLFELHGFKPLYQMHTDSYDRDLLSEFTFEGTKRFYYRVSEMLKLNPQVKGVFGISWLNDPRLKEISPELWPGLGFALENGAEIFNWGSSDSAIKLATGFSFARKSLYAEGKYMPTNYLLIWSREKLICWANRNPISLVGG